MIYKLIANYILVTLDDTSCGKHHRGKSPTGLVQGRVVLQTLMENGVDPCTCFDL